MRMSASWFWIRRSPICCCVISVSRLTDSVSRSISSLRRYQKAEMMAARKSSTDNNGPSVAKRSWRAGDWLRHQRPKRRLAPDRDASVGDDGSGNKAMGSIIVGATFQTAIFHDMK